MTTDAAASRPAVAASPSGGRLLFATLIGAVLAYLGFCLMIGALQRKLIYFPEHDSASRQAAAERAGYGLWRSDDGTTLGWSTPPRPGSDAWVVFHGNAGTALDRTYVASSIFGSDPQATVYLFEYPGYGPRDGDPSEEAIVVSATRAVGALSGHPRVYLVGESLGAAVAAAVAARRPRQIDGLVLITPFNRLADVAAHHYPFLPVRLLLRERYESDRALTSWQGPISFVMAGRDEIIPNALTQRLHDGYGGPRQLLVVPEAGHNEVFDDVSWWPEAAAFVRTTR